MSGLSTYSNATPTFIWNVQYRVVCLSSILPNRTKIGQFGLVKMRILRLQGCKPPWGSVLHVEGLYVNGWPSPSQIDEFAVDFLGIFTYHPRPIPVGRSPLLMAWSLWGTRWHQMANTLGGATSTHGIGRAVSIVHGSPHPGQLAKEVSRL
jgi:hypothetical protein